MENNYYGYIGDKETKNFNEIKNYETISHSPVPIERAMNASQIPQIAQWMDNETMALERLQRLVEDLFSKLSPLLRNSPPLTCDKNPEQNIKLVPLAEVIRKNVESINMACNKIENIFNTMEL